MPTMSRSHPSAPEPHRLTFEPHPPVTSNRGPERCLVPPSPELLDRLEDDLAALQEHVSERMSNRVLLAAEPRRPGLNDGLILPGNMFPLGTSLDRVTRAASERAPLHGTLRVVVVLVDFDDRAMTRPASEFRDLFFSEGVLPDGSVREYLTEVSNGLVTLDGEVVGPYRLPQDLSAYANGASGTGTSLPNARTMARDAAEAADADVDFSAYDNDGNGFVDAFIVLHAGPGAEQTGSPNDIWSHKWVLSGGVYETDGTKIYGYLTVPEDARIGVCAHELGHLLFGWPDLYDTDGSSSGIGNWCLMAGGSWNGGGDVPAHPSAWCKADQGWVSVAAHSTNSTVTISDVKDDHTVHRLWKAGSPGQEYFLVENRQRTRYDRLLPGEGLLVWHIDEAIATNSNEDHPKVALEQADGLRHLEHRTNRGDAGDAYPGSSDNRAFTASSTPNSRSYGNMDTCVSITAISDSSPVMTVNLKVVCFDRFKLIRDKTSDKLAIRDKPLVEGKWWRKEIIKEKEKEFGIDKRPEKPEIDKGRAGYEKPPITEKGRELPDIRRAEVDDAVAYLEARVAALEAMLGGGQPFIEEELRPDLSGSALSEEGDLEMLRQRLAGGDPAAKSEFDAKPPEA
jgi:immune inhibitor A